ncbi:hypothetical protein NKR23_g11898 [Pleurostoma richardsiae]|uniref:BZIP domain-containing protein n=1 Tax=Pleurostoma richardsiae TaxID=41990 RepID=A0AA38R935_9PEZI|nr:hypothetical protein NKR23_g11898 [Pleurostoma richardsiae]
MEIQLANANNQAIELTPMAPQLQARKPDEDWTGVTNTVERKRLQNRLNQRAMRKSKRRARSDENGSPPSDGQPPPSPSQIESALHVCRLSLPERRARLERFAGQAFADYVSGKACLAHLPALVQFNVFQALARNAAMLGVATEWLIYDSLSPFGREGPGLGLSHPPIAAGTLPSCPDNLRPTPLQLTVPHHPWIDLFPIPRMRDNLLLATADPGLFDEDGLCSDVMEAGGTGWPEEPALIVWGEPWDPRGWEATTAFLRKWGWLLGGCGELLEATNFWREKRGERRLELGV